MNFEDSLREHLESDPKLTRRGARILAILNGRKGRLRARRIAMMEAHATAAMQTSHGVLVGAPIDWANVDWPKIISTILDVLLKLLPLILAL